MEPTAPTKDLPFIVALCPTFRHPTLLANSLALWEMQTYPRTHRHLIIFDDGNTFDEFYGIFHNIRTFKKRFPSLPAKYNAMLEWAYGITLQQGRAADAFLIWEDDDIYLPGYVAAHAAVLAAAEYSKPRWVLTDYPGYVDRERGDGRFHSSIGFQRSLIERIGGWPETKRADFDQALIGRLEQAKLSAGDPWLSPQDMARDVATPVRDIQYVMGWHTGAAHGQGAMRSPDDETWWDRCPDIYAPVEPIQYLDAKLDNRTIKIFQSLGVKYDA